MVSVLNTKSKFHILNLIGQYKVNFFTAGLTFIINTVSQNVSFILVRNTDNFLVLTRNDC